MREKLEKIKPYVKWGRNSLLTCDFQFPGEWKIYLDIYNSKEPFYRFNVERNGDVWERVPFGYLYERIKGIDVQFASECRDEFDVTEDQQLTEQEKEMFLCMIYYLVTDIAYYSVVRKDSSKRMSKELHFFLIDILTEDNPYLSSVVAQYTKDK